jgi:release factor glutamine methyltransferase
MATAVAGSVREALTSARDALVAAGVDTPRLDAELLLSEATGLGRAALVADPEAGVDARAARRFGEFVRRRLRREPVAYIVGRRGFRNLELALDSRVLIPRPETELLVDVALELKPRTVLDVGTGSGAVALAVADELDEVSVTGTDVSERAIAVARANAERLSLAVDLHRVGAETGYGRHERPINGPWDLVLANLPYVCDDEWDGLAPEIREYEPREALLGGHDGLEVIRVFLTQPLDAGAIALEVGAGQAPTVADLVRAAGFEHVETRRDLAGIDRVVVGRS